MVVFTGKFTPMIHAGNLLVLSSPIEIYEHALGWGHTNSMTQAYMTQPRPPDNSIWLKYGKDPGGRGVHTTIFLQCRNDPDVRLKFNLIPNCYYIVLYFYF